MANLSRLVISLTVAILLNGYGANAMSGRGTVCTDNANVRDATACLVSALKGAETGMTKKYTDVEVLLKTVLLRKQLVRSQATWKLYVAQTCDGLIDESAKDEPVGSADVLSCKVELTRERTGDLDRMFYVPLHD